MRDRPIAWVVVKVERISETPFAASARSTPYWQTVISFRLRVVVPRLIAVHQVSASFPVLGDLLAEFLSAIIDMRTSCVSCVLLLCVSNITMAEVTSSDQAGFSLKHTVQVRTTADKSWQAFTEIGSWWSPAHTWSGDAKNMSLNVKPGGYFLEKLPDGGFVRHMEVVYAAPGKLIRLHGGLGPLQEQAVHGAMSVTFNESEGATTINITYNVGGYVPGGLNPWASIVDGVITEQFDRLRQRIEGTSAQ